MMRKHMLIRGLAALLALVLVAETAQAQGYMRGRGYGFGNSGVGYGWSSRPYSSPYYGGYYPGYSRYYYTPYQQNYYYPGMAYNPYGVYPYSPYLYTTPSFTSYDVESVPATTQSFYPSENRKDNTARMRVVVPEPNARVWIDGTLTQQTGTNRLFYSPPVEPGKSYAYTVRASWMENGREVTQEKTVKLQLGQEVDVQFGGESIRAAGSATETHVGKIIRAGGGTITMTDLQGGNPRTHDVPESAKITSAGKDTRLENLPEGAEISVTTKADDPKTVVAIDAKSREPK